MKRPDALPGRRSAGLLALALTLVLGGCDDGFEPLIWGNFPDTVALHSLARPEFVHDPSAFDFISRLPIVVEQQRPNPEVFDIAVTEADDGTFLLLPAGVFADFNIRPGIQRVPGATFDGLTTAPRDEYVVEEPVAAELNAVYAVRSRQQPNGCFAYGKMEVIELDPAGILTFRALRNPNCSDRSLVPNAPVEDDEDEEDDGEA